MNTTEKATVSDKREVTQITARVPNPVKKTIRLDSVQVEISSNEIFGMIIADFLDRHRKPEDRHAFYRQHRLPAGEAQAA